MAKFRKNTKNEVGAINTASLPDIVFMLLFFFMVSTVIREVSLKINVVMPKVSEVKKLEKKSLVSYIYVGKPNKEYEKLFGTEPRLQLNDQLASINEVRDFITTEREQMDERDRNMMTVSLKVDENVKMGIITDLKQALRKASALKINYSAKKGDI